MSCVVAIKDNKRVYMAAETAATTMEGDRRLIDVNKIIRNGKYLIGFTGSVRVGQLLHPHFFKPPTNIMDFPDALMEHLDTKKGLVVSEESAVLLQCNILIGFKNKLYELLSDFQLNQPSVEYTSVGSGSPYALGSLATTSELGIKTPRDRLEMALNCACLFSAECKGPYMFMET